MRVRVGIALAFVVDLALKEFVRRLPETAARFAFPTPIGVIGLVPSVNDVLAFSLPIPNAWIWPIGWVVVLVLVRALGRSCKLQAASCKPIAAILLGAISNLTDRTLRGGVTDYLALTDQFPAFNLADLLIIGGVAAWVWRAR